MGDEDEGCGGWGVRMRAVGVGGSDDDEVCWKEGRTQSVRNVTCGTCVPGFH